MKQRRNRPTLRSIHAAFTRAAIAAALIPLLACSSKPNSKLSAEKTFEREPALSAKGRSAPGQASDDPGINLNCVYDRLQNPPESFHYVYKKTVSDSSNVDQEADVTPQTIDGFRGQPDGSRQPIHAMRSDSQGWQSAPDGGQINGYQTIHYSIDTARWDATTRQMLGSFTLGPGGFDKGDAWVMADGCPVKLVLDDEMHNKDGSLLERIHYEESMAKK